MEEGFKRHHHHHHRHDKVHVRPFDGERRHSKRKRPTAKISGDYEVKQLAGQTMGRQTHEEQSYNADSFSNTNDAVHPTTNPDTDYYAEYKFDDGKMTVEDNGKYS